MNTEAITLQRAPHVQLAAWLHLPAKPPTAVGVLVHGLGEHAGRYQQMARWFTQAGVALLVYDLRGHGHSSGQRGHARYRDLLADAGAMVEQARQRFPELPLFLYGHSLGGNIALSYILQQPDGAKEVRGLVLSAPWLKLAFAPPKALLALARAMAKLYPAFSQANRLQPAWLSRNPAVGKAYLADPLVHDRISAGLFCQVHDAGRAVLRSDPPELPMLILHGSDDPITSFRSSQRYARKAGATFLEGTNLRHEQHQEPEGEEVVAQVLEWVLKLV